MATDLERLVVSLSADIKSYENALRRAQGVTTRNAQRIESTFARANRNVAAGFTALGAKIAGAFAVAGGVRGAQRLIDTATKINNSLKVAGLSGTELTKVYDSLFASAQKNAAPLESLVTLYGRVAQAQDSLGVSQEQIVNFADKIAVALRVSGASAQEASGALLQLGQALGAGTVRAEEYNSINEGARPILQAVAAGLKEAGGSVAKLRQLVIDGQVSSEAFFRAFEAGSVVLEEKVAGSTFTVSQGFERINNALIDAAGRMDRGAQLSTTLATALDALATAINSFDVSVLSNELGAMSNDLARTIEDLNRWVEAYGRVKAALGQGDFAAALSAAGGFLAPSEGPSNVQVAGGKGPRVRPVTTTASTAPGQVSIADAPALGGGSGKSRGSRTRQSDYAREIEQIKERTAALQAETAAMAGLNPLIDDYGFAIEKARAEHELLAAAQASGLTITPELKAQIEQLATAYAQAGVDAERLAESQDMVRERAQEMADLGKDVFGGFIRDLRNGVSAADALKGALDRIADALLNNVLDAIFQVNSAGGGGGSFLGSIFGALGGGGFSAAAYAGIGQGLYAKGGYTGPGGKNQPKGVVHGGEYVFSKEAVQRAGVGNLEAMHRSLKGYANGGLVAPAIPRIGASAGGNVVIKPVVNNNSSKVTAETQTRTNGDGSVDIITTINDVVAKGAITRGSPVNNALRKGFGAQQALKRR